MPSDNEKNISQGGGQLRGEGANQLLKRISSMLSELLERDEIASIDLGEEKLDQWDYARLQEVLGWGDIEADLGEPVATRVLSTAIPGVWWVSHLNEDGEVIAEFIEVGYCPEVMIASVEEVRDGWGLLRARRLALRFE